MVNHKEEVVSDSEKFKADFEQYNGLMYEDTNESVIDVNIPEDNPFIYKTGKEIVDVLENETAYVLFGYSSCPLTRAAIEVLITAIEEASVSKVYYVDIKDMRDEYVHKDSIIPEKTKKGTEMAFLECSDETGVCEFILFPEVYKKYNDLHEKELIMLNGKVEKRFDKTKIIVNNIKRVGGLNE